MKFFNSKLKFSVPLKLVNYFLLFITLIFAIPLFSQTLKLAPPETGIYQGAFPDMGATEDSVTKERILEFDSLVRNPAVWVYFSDNWFKGIIFPGQKVETIKSLGKIPFIRMMPRSGFFENSPDPVYTLQKIIDGIFDNELIQYAKDAKDTKSPLMIEFGCEMNGDWFSWSGKFNGGGNKNEYGNPELADGPERFRDAYRHIINIFRKEGVGNVTWVYHLNSDSFPAEDWNTMSAYYPGDDYIDWIGASVYGAQIPGEKWKSFTDIMDRCYIELSGISEIKPLAVLEFGVIEEPEKGNKSNWIQEALQSLIDGNYPRIKAISYWHSAWQNENKKISNLRIDSSIGSLKVYRKLINNPIFKPIVIFSE
jgi:hypothetical protein